jgi:hypothetical protein
MWDPYIRDKLPEASKVLTFMSSESVPKAGFVQTEFRLCLKYAATRPTPQGWLIPVLLDECEPPAHRVDTVSFADFQWYALYRDGMPRLLAYLKASLPVGDKITAEHLALIHSCWREPKHDARFPGHDVYRFDVVLAAPQSILKRIDEVTYLLPPAWPTSPQTVSDWEIQFGLKELAWADVLVRANVKVRDQDEPIHLSSFVRLTEEGRHLVPKKTP